MSDLAHEMEGPVHPLYRKVCGSFSFAGNGNPLYDVVWNIPTSLLGYNP